MEYGKVRKNLLRKDCVKCRKVFSIDDLVPPLKNFAQMFGYENPSFYGGNVNKFTKIDCKCGNKYILYWKKDGNGFKLKDIELTYSDNTEEIEKVKKEVEELKKEVSETEERTEKSIQKKLVSPKKFETFKQPEQLKYLRQVCNVTVPNDKKSKKDMLALYENFVEEKTSQKPVD